MIVRMLSAAMLAAAAWSGPSLAGGLLESGAGAKTGAAGKVTGEVLGGSTSTDVQVQGEMDSSFDAGQDGGFAAEADASAEAGAEQRTGAGRSDAEIGAGAGFRGSVGVDVR